MSLAGAGAAAKGGDALIADLEQWRYFWGKKGRKPLLTIIGHSYGSVVGGHAAVGGVAADNLVFLGSPGTARTAKNLNTSLSRIFVAANDSDIVTWFNWFSASPVSTKYGDVTRMRTGRKSGGDPHEYLDAGTESLRNVARVIVGKFGEVTAKPLTGTWAWQNPLGRFFAEKPTKRIYPLAEEARRIAEVKPELDALYDLLEQFLTDESKSSDPVLYLVSSVQSAVAALKGVGAGGENSGGNLRNAAKKIVKADPAMESLLKTFTSGNDNDAIGYALEVIDLGIDFLSLTYPELAQLGTVYLPIKIKIRPPDDIATVLDRINSGTAGGNEADFRELAEEVHYYRRAMILRTLVGHLNYSKNLDWKKILGEKAKEAAAGVWLDEDELERLRGNFYNFEGRVQGRYGKDWRKIWREGSEKERLKTLHDVFYRSNIELNKMGPDSLEAAEKLIMRKAEPEEKSAPEEESKNTSVIKSRSKRGAGDTGEQAGPITTQTIEDEEPEILSTDIERIMGAKSQLDAMSRILAEAQSNLNNGIEVEKGEKGRGGRRKRGAVDTFGNVQYALSAINSAIDALKLLAEGKEADSKLKDAAIKITGTIPIVGTAIAAVSSAKDGDVVGYALEVIDLAITLLAIANPVIFGPIGVVFWFLKIAIRPPDYIKDIISHAKEWKAAVWGWAAPKNTRRHSKYE